MIVDPFTGLPVEEGAEPIAPQSIVGATGQSFMSDPNSVGYQVMGNLPGMSTMIGWNMARGQNTIMGRGTATKIASGQGRWWAGDNWKSSTFNTLSPSRMFRLPNAGAVFQDSGPNNYSPFNAAAKGGNWLAKRAAATASGAKVIERSIAGSGFTAADIVGGKATLFDGGTLARLGVSRRLSGMSTKTSELSRRDQKRLTNTLRSLQQVGVVPEGFGGITGRRAAELTLRSFKGIHSQRLAGHLGGMMNITNAGGIGMNALNPTSSIYDDAFRASRATVTSGASAIGSSVDDVLKAKTMRSAGMAFQGVAKGNMKFAGAMAGKAALMGGSKFVPILGQVLLARDIMSMASAGIKKGAEFSRDAAKSFQGQIQKPIFGMGYKDNAVNATSRARGLTAIQSSRLNARNALGHEAGMLANHYG